MNIAVIWKDLWTPERAMGWEWAALFGGHVFIGCVMAAGLLAHTSIDPYIIDSVCFLAYLAFKEFFDFIRSRDWRDAILDSVGVGWGAYILTSCALDKFDTAFNTGLMALAVAAYGYYHTKVQDARSSGNT